MRKLIITVLIILFAGITLLDGQEELSEQQWSCIAETVKPEKVDQYLELSLELIQLCKEENFPFAFHTWSYDPMEYELWSPLESLDDIEKMEEAWDNIVKKWGSEKYAAFNATKTKNYAKTCNVRWDMMFNPANPDYDPENADFGRWIEVYLKSGTGKQFEEAIQWISQKREAHDYGVRCIYAECGLGYETPSYLVMYTHESLLGLLESENSMDDTYKADYQEYLLTIRKLFAKPVKFYNIHYHPELSYSPAEE